MATFQYPLDLADRLRAAWAGPQWRGIVPEPLPPDDVLLSLLEVCFHASFTADEQRGTRFSVFFGKPDETLNPFVLGREIQFNVQELKRLAPAAFSAIGVRLGTTGDDAKIWGFAGVPLVTTLSIDVVGPGMLEIRGTWGTVALHGGRVHDYWSENVSAALMLELFPAAFDAFFSTIKEDRVNEVHYRQYFGNQYLTLLQAVASHGHGGTVLVVPEREGHEQADWRRFVRVKYPCDEATLWSEVLGAVREGDGPHLRDFASLDRRTKNVSRLTQVDGALLVTDRLRILGFGVEVTAPATDLDTVTDGDAQVSIEDYGTRHRSAFRMCKASPSTVAFVCSQDGGIKCVRNTTGRVVLIR